MDDRNLEVLPPILLNKHFDVASAFAPESLLREARRQKDLPNTPAPEICILDPAGDIALVAPSESATLSLTSRRTKTMKRFALIAGLAQGISGGAFSAADAATVQPYEQAAFDAAQHSGEPVLIFVEAPWCPTCAKERPILQQLYATPAFANLKVFDVDFDTSKVLLRRLGVHMQSTLIVYHGTRETGRITGATDPAVIKKLLETSAS